MNTVLNTLCQVLKVIGILLQPFMPDTMARLLELLGLAPEARGWDALDVPLAAGAALPAPVGLFPRVVE